MPFSFALSQCRQRVRCFSTLGDCKDHRVMTHRRISVSQLAGVLDFGRDSSELFQQILAYQSGVPACSARGQHDAVDLSQMLRVDIQSAELGGRRVVVDPAPHAVFESFRLLEDFFQHVVIVAAQIEIVGNLIEYVYGRLLFSGIAMVKFETFRTHDSEFVVGEVNNFVGVTE